MDILGKAGRWADFLRQDALSALPDGGSPARPYTLYQPSENTEVAHSVGDLTQTI